MNPILNYTPQVYEAIIAAFIVVGLIQSFALRRKWKQAEELKASITELAAESTKVVKDVIAAGTKAVVTSALTASVAIAKAQRETKIVRREATEALKYADERLTELEAQVNASQAAQTESRLDDLEAEVAELQEDREDNERPQPETRSPAAFRFGSPGPFAGGGVDPLAALFGSLGRNAPGVGRSPKIQAFRLSPNGGLVPVRSPADFGLPEMSTFNAPPPGGERAPSLKDILSLLASIPRPRPGPSADMKADLSGTETRAFLHDQFGPVAPGDDPYAVAADAARASVAAPTVEAEACDTQRAPVAGGGVESPANDPGARSVPRHRPLPDSFPGFGIPSPRAG